MIERNTLMGLLVLSSTILFYYTLVEKRYKEELDQNYVQDYQGNHINLEAPEGMVNDLWHHFMARYMRTYESEVEQQRRFSIFRNNYRIIYRHNMQYFHKKGYSTYFLDTNEYSDMSNEEFIKRNGFRMGKKEGDTIILEEGEKTTNAFDWRDQGMISEVKNQGNCGSCWAFATIGSVESCRKINQRKEQQEITSRSVILDLSEQQLVDCSVHGGNNGCQGGTMPQAFDYIIKEGVMSEHDYPYQAQQQPCRYDAAKKVYQIKEFRNVKEQESEQLKRAVQINPVAVAIDASGVHLQFYRGGVFSSNCGTDLNHAVLLVGFAYQEMDSKQDAHKYYIVKNSWGTSWGEDGYIRMVDNEPFGKGVCGIQMYSSYPVQ